MITALSPRSYGSSILLPEAKSSLSEEPAPRPADEKWKMPSPAWERNDYEHAMFRMIIDENTEGADRINKAYLETSEASQGINRDTWEARNESYRIQFGNGGNLQRLEALADKHPSDPKILQDLALALITYRSFDEAAKRFEAAAQFSSEKSEEIRLMGLAALQHESAGSSKRVSEVISQLRASAKSDTNSEVQLLDTLRELAERAKQNDALIATMERLVELKPDDISIRFALAYTHAENGNDDLALINYLLIPYKVRGAGTWNNLGVAYDKFKIWARAVAAYSEAEKMGESLAMSNLGTKLVDIGMINEAMLKCEKALKVENYHKNVTDLISRIKGIPQDEEKRTEELVEKSKPKREFYKSLGRAITVAQPISLSEHWVGPDCPLDLHLSNGEVRLSGTYELESNPFGGIVQTPPGVTISKIKHRVEYSLSLRGHALDGVVKRTREGGLSAVATGLLALGDSDLKVLMVLSEDQTEIKVMENPHGVGSRFYSIRKSTTKPQTRLAQV